MRAGLLGVWRLCRWLAVVAVITITLADRASASLRPRAGDGGTVASIRVERPLALGLSGSELQLGTGSLSNRMIWGQRAQYVGTQIVRIGVYWAAIAPGIRPRGFQASNPDSRGYAWRRLDEMVKSITADGFQVMLSVDDAPRWAQGPNRPASVQSGTWKPDPADYAAFATALARRYDGHWPDPAHRGDDLPRVSDWQAWNEPNLYTGLMPQWTRTSSGGYVEQSPSIYRGLLNAFYAAVKGVSEQNFVVAAGTAPYGDPIGSVPLDRARTAPVVFDRDLFCLTGSDRALACPARAHFDAIDTHPYGPSPSTRAIEPNDVAVPDIGKLTRLLGAARRAGTVSPVGPKQTWVSEITYDTDPPVHGGVPFAEDAQWAQETEYELWSENVSTVMWAGLADRSTVFGLAGGLYLKSGQPKPAAAAFRFPFVEIGRGRDSIVIWSRAPSTGLLTVQEEVNGAWQNVAQFNVRSAEVFELHLALAPGAVIRGSLGTSLSSAAQFFTG